MPWCYLSSFRYRIRSISIFIYWFLVLALASTFLWRTTTWNSPLLLLHLSLLFAIVNVMLDIDDIILIFPLLLVVFIALHGLCIDLSLKAVLELGSRNISSTSWVIDQWRLGKNNNWVSLTLLYNLQWTWKRDRLGRRRSNIWGLNHGFKQWWFLKPPSTI